MNKVTKNICELVKRASTLCILEISNPQDEYENKQFKKFQDQITKHLTEIKDYKNDFYISESIAYARITCSKLGAKLKPLEKSKSDKVSRIIITKELNSCNNQINSEWKSLLVKIDNETDDSQFSNNIKESFNKNEDFKDFIEKIVDIHAKFYSDIKNKMKGIETIEVFSASLKMDLDVTTKNIEYSELVSDKPNILKKFIIVQEDIWKVVQTDDKNIIELKEMEKKMDALYKSHGKIEEDKDWKNDIKPMLDENKKTLKIPSAECSFNIEKINKFIRTYPTKNK